MESQCSIEKLTSFKNSFPLNIIISQARSQCNEDATIYIRTDSFIFSISFLFRGATLSRWASKEGFDRDVEAGSEYKVGSILKLQSNKRSIELVFQPFIAVLP